MTGEELECIRNAGAARPDPLPKARVCEVHETNAEHLWRLEAQILERERRTKARPVCDCCGQYTDYPNNRPKPMSRSYTDKNVLAKAKAARIEADKPSAGGE